MTRYAVFLRGVNVGGVKVMSMDLRALLASLGFDDAKTWLQTGNITLSSDQRPDGLKDLLEQALSERFGYDAKAMVYDLADLRTIVEDYPFPAGEDLHRYVVLVSDETILPELLAVANQLDAEVERIAPGPGVLYWQLPKGRSLDTDFAKLMTRAKVKRVTTTRNLNTLAKMVAA